MGLSTTPEYTIIELTARDIGTILKSVWLRADDNPIRMPVQRVIFHTLVLLFSFGFRKGMIMGLWFRDISMAIVRDPEDRTKKRLVSITTIHWNKLRRNALEHKKGKKYVLIFISFS